MGFLIVLSIALALAMDCFAVTLGISLSRGKLFKSQKLRLAFSFGFFQAVMTAAGWIAGKSILLVIHAFDHWVAFGLLLFIGGKMIYASFRRKDGTTDAETDPARGLSLLFLSVATSIDALAAGMSFAVLNGTILFPAVVIGMVTFLMTILGASVGPSAGRIVGRRAELLGGSILILVGIKILTEHI